MEINGSKFYNRHNFGRKGFTMPRDIAERDWKVFKELHAIAMDRFFEKAVKEMQPLLWAKNKPAQERFWDALTYAAKQRKQAARLFDGSSRSNTSFMAGLIYANQFLTDEEIARFTPELQEQLRSIAVIARM